MPKPTKRFIHETILKNWNASKTNKVDILRIHHHTEFATTLVFYTVTYIAGFKTWRIASFPHDRESGGFDMITKTEGKS